uniref:Heme chaperone HemW n=1 Tax=Candidatus Kentrum sp. TUN TaxID=2126343 RepID=A0A451APF9_9GAMM|nr:MAG: oxygen-independent coproporphyrinogen-3 oxidase [Candidatus Kentron sp. TUN]VFK67903.1 MAG: oxygen-independent coproporphyrinogen-3 oxidase [Candidatus Kentron sp. TUN]
MAGIYIHIPFCKQLCYYCDFHFSLSLRDKDEMVIAILRELELRRDYFDGDNQRETQDRTIATLYFGGGTPSMLDLATIEAILNKIHSLFRVRTDAEVTLEANPDDLTPDYLSGLSTLGINRLSIGIQSFHDQELQVMNRRHTTRQALDSIRNALRSGFENITIDLMYGLPDSTPETWRYSLETALALPIPHFSCYHLSFEEKTAFADFKKKGKLNGVSDDNSWEQYRSLCEKMKAKGYEHYEISNFAKKGWRSCHNMACWLGDTYLGIGPSAHSFNGKSRQWNIAHNLKYRESISRETDFHEMEILSEKEKFHDYLLTRLRTMEGIDLRYLQDNFTEFYPRFYKTFIRYSDTDLLKKKGNTFRLTEKGLFQSDAMIMKLMQD